MGRELDHSSLHSRKLSVPHLPFHCFPNTLLRSPLSFQNSTWGIVMDYIPFQPNAVQSNYYTLAMKNICPSYTSFSSIMRLQHFAAMEFSVNVGEILGFGEYFQSNLCSDSAEKQEMSEEVLLDVVRDSSENVGSSKKGPEKRNRKHGNKGKIPWNKGRRHTTDSYADQTETIEALRDPQVRKKMSEHPHAHSDKNKAKISFALRQYWGRRLKWKRLGEKIFSSWTKCIAQVAKTGGDDQQELDWDSYDKIKQEMTLQQLQYDMDKAKDRVSRAKGENIGRFTDNSEDWEETGEETAHQNSVGEELTLRKRLTRIRNVKSKNGKGITQGEALISHGPVWERLDVELMTRERIQGEASLADQIQPAKKRMNNI